MKMQYEELADFIENRMRMSHIYQPVMLLTLLQNDGLSSTNDIARAISEHDQSQIEYYEKITENMVGRVLRNHRIAQKIKKNYRLLDFETLSKVDKEKLITLCKQKLEEYMKKRGDKIWTHRKRSTGYISGTKKYDVLARAKQHCELCGISNDIRALEVDHIIPKNKGGSNDPSNLQALCYRCNAMKRDSDTTDFRKMRESFELRDDACLFCYIDEGRVMLENELAYSVYDGFPVTPLHALIIPKRHVSTYFDLGQSEINACTRILNEIKRKIESEDRAVTGFNIGVNDGETAGQTVFHCHIHLIPR
jgi:diadenosine tetraphosphate (Ap4A) HIT family hydrolase